MHKHLLRVYTFALDILMLLLLLAAPVASQPKPLRPTEGTDEARAEFKGNAEDLAGQMIERRKQRRS